MSQKVAIIGLDCATPQLVFDRWFDELPNIKRVAESGIWGRLRSTDPPITVPAWQSMMTGKNPGKLGFYGLRNRKDYSYDKFIVASGALVKDDRVWDVLSRLGKQCTVIGVPQTYPVRPLNGYLVSCFLTPSTKNQFTYPDNFRQEVEEVTGGYILDCENYRTDDKDELLAQIYRMTERRFKLARHMVQKHPWDFFMMVEMGPDRLHHGFWKYTDPEHPRYEKGNPLENCIYDYYRYVDREIGTLLELFGEETTVLIVSDHGAKPLLGGICLNEWLIKEGYLTLKSKPEGVVPLEKCEIDYSKTMAWGAGGYYGRLVLNVRGREPEGIIDPADFEKVRQELIDKLEALPNHKGENIGTIVLRPEECYPVVNNIPPDLFVYFGDLYWRSIGSIGTREIYTFDNDTGPDDANHAQHGIFAMGPVQSDRPGVREGLDIKDVASTVLSLFGVDVPSDMEGQVIS